LMQHEAQKRMRCNCKNFDDGIGRYGKRKCHRRRIIKSNLRVALSINRRKDGSIDGDERSFQKNAVEMRTFHHEPQRLSETLFTQPVDGGVTRSVGSINIINS
jgi:hypothetical protein